MSHTATVQTAKNKNEQNIADAVAELKRQGVNCDIEYNATPRLWTHNQLARDLGREKHPTDECAVVVRLHDAYYDVGFYRNDEGNLIPVFDDYNGPATIPHKNKGSKSVRDVIGAKFAGRIEHWNGLRTESEGNEGSQQLRHSIGRLMQGIHKAQAVRRARSMGHTILGTTTDEKGHVHIRVGIVE
jgi:hypothetical protein